MQQGVLIWIIIIILVILFILFHLSNKSKVNESFDNNNSKYIKSGISQITSSSGTINFSSSFSNIPSVYTQVLSSSTTDFTVINVYNVTTSGFSYNKSIVKEQTSDEMAITVMEEDNTTSFQWIAYDYISMNSDDTTTSEES